MNGTTLLDTLAMLLRPPQTMAPVRTARKRDVYSGSIPKVRFVISEMAFTCVKVPLPRQAVATPNAANITARGLNFGPRPASM